MADRLFVGREGELARLEYFLGQALGGRGQIAFVTGEAGSGKTALVQAFAEEAGHSNDLVVALGNCSAHSDMADPYLPFREVLGILSGLEEQASKNMNTNASRLGRIAGRTAQILVEVGPDLVGSIVPGAALLAKIGKVVVQKVGWLERLEKLVQSKPLAIPQAAMEQGRIFEQYANVLKTLAKEQPLLIVLDDLHWADEASIGLLFHLSRRIEHSSILLIGTYRSHEIAFKTGERHPLERALNEIKRQAGNVWIDLDQTQQAEKRAFIDRWLDSEPNELGEEFRQALFRHTEGNPLFTIELLRTLQERGDLAQNAQGRWVQRASLIWDSLPARIEGVVEERLGRLEENQRELLRTASVEGESFTAEALAQMQQTPLRQLLKELSQNLEKHHRLVLERGGLKIGQTLLTGYSFAHVLFQDYLYRELGAGERRLLHGELAQVLGQLYAGHTQEIAAQLAWHYDQAGQTQKAAEHLITAAQLANQQGAPREAKRFTDRALELIGESDELYWQALVTRHTALLRLGDSPALQTDSTALVGFSQRLQDRHKSAEAYYRQLLSINITGNAKAIAAAAEQAVQAAQQAGNLALEARGLQFKMLAQHRLGEVVAALATAEVALERAKQCGDNAVLAGILSGMAIAYDEASDPQKAVDLNIQALALAQQTEARTLEARILVVLGNTYRGLGLYTLAQTTLEQALEANAAMGARRERAYVLDNLGLVHVARHNPTNANPLLEEALTESVAIGDEYLQAACYRTLGYIAEQSGHIELATQHFDQARSRFEALNLFRLAMEPIAGLARLALVQGDLKTAQSYADLLWQYLTQHGINSLVLEAHLACAEVFKAAGNLEDAKRVIESSYRELIDRAYKISNPEWREAFLENVPENKQVLQYWQKIHTS
ncbi:MAG: AAA family ATPase [Meiothermus sp.]|nr:AAA family ATPase [Meiothermus sp.]